MLYVHHFYWLKEEGICRVSWRWQCLCYLRFVWMLKRIFSDVQQMREIYPWNKWVGSCFLWNLGFLSAALFSLYCNICFCLCLHSLSVGVLLCLLKFCVFLFFMYIRQSMLSLLWLFFFFSFHRLSVLSLCFYYSLNLSVYQSVFPWLSVCHF